MPDPAAAKPSTVLIVDDSQENLRLAARFLESLGGFNPVLVRNPTRVVDMALRCRPEAILMDIMMPGLDGYEVCRQLKREPVLADVPVVFLTAKEDEDSIGTAFAAGGVDYVVKPLDRRALGTRLRVHIDHYRARQEVRRSEARLREAQAIARLGDWELDRESGLFLGSSWTFQLCRLVGSRSTDDGTLHVSQDELLNTILPDHRERLVQLFRCQPGQGNREARCRSVVDGKVRELLFVAHAEEPGESSGAGVIGTVQDITERVAALESLRRAEARLLESKQIEVVGRLAGGVAHEFNNLLQAILGYSSMLARRLEEGSRERALVDPILTATGRARELVSQIMLVGRQGVFTPQSVDLAEFVERFVPTVDTVLKVAMPTTVVTEPCSPIWGDRGLLEQILMNLCQNAEQATADGGSVTVTVAPVDVPEPLPAAGSTVHPGRYVRLTVGDTGVGIADDVRDRVLEPFFSTRGVGRGTGLGLPAVQGIARQHDAHLVIESHVGKGTNVSVYFPPHETVNGIGMEANPLEALPARVLVVAKDELVRGILALHLGELDCEVLAAAEVGEGRSVLADRHLPIEALVVDLQDLGGDGDWLLHVAGQMPVLVVLAETAGTGGETVPDGVVPIERPFTAESLRQALLTARRG
jgi:signal transduction histidine kinase